MDVHIYVISMDLPAVSRNKECRCAHYYYQDCCEHQICVVDLSMEVLEDPSPCSSLIVGEGK